MVTIVVWEGVGNHLRGALKIIDVDGGASWNIYIFWVASKMDLISLWYNVLNILAAFLTSIGWYSTPICIANTVCILFYMRSTQWNHLWGNWTGPYGCHLLSELERRHQNSILNMFLLKTSFHCLLSFTFVTFLIHCTLSPAGSCISCRQSCFVCSRLTKYTVEVVPICTCVLC